jgi:hypothetical protein
MTAANFFREIKAGTASLPEMNVVSNLRNGMSIWRLGLLSCCWAFVAVATVGVNASAEGVSDVPALLKLPLARPTPTPMFHGSPEVNVSAHGPWGQVEYFEAFLEAPVGLLKESELSSFRSVWHFPKTTSADVAQLITGLDLPSDLQKNLFDQKRWSQFENTVSVSVDRGILEQLPRKSREEIYRRLSESSLNRFHVEPEVVFAKTPREWLQEYGFDEELVRFVELTCYKRGECLVFSDILTALEICRSDEERLRFRQALSRTPTIVAKLLINSSPIPVVADYWGRGTRFKNTLPFLESMARVPGADKIDVIHLLPASVRRILYTFPNPLRTENGYLPDCHWTSLNFFNPEPLERLSDPIQATQYTLENFHVVEAPYQCGDVLFFTDLKTGDAYHSCAYIADDIVFTKNGRSPLQPWVLMKIEQVKILYDLHFRTQTIAYRRKF